MDKPWDAKALLLKLEAKGLKILKDQLPALENAAQETAGVVCDWVKESLELSPFPLKLAAPLVDTVKGLALKGLDKIDGVEGQ